MKRQFLMTIETDDKNIAEKFPNWRWNFATSDEFIKHTAESKVERSYQDVGGKMQSMWKQFGYRVTVKAL